MSAVGHQLSPAYPRASRVRAGRLEVGGCDAVALARDLGTPAYVVAEDDIRACARAYLGAARAHHADSQVIFATKAFPCTAVLALLASEGLGCDVASGGELALALRAGLAPEDIYLHGNAKGEDELGFALDAGVGHVVVDGLDELERLERLVAERGDGRRQPVLLRVTPGVAPGTHAAISTGQVESKFGFGLAAAPAAIDRARRSSALDLVGLHIHIGSQALELEAFRAAIAQLAPLGEFPVYDLGGGLGVAYTAADRPPAIEEWVDAVLETARAALGEQRRFVLEPGRSLVANAGVTLYTVVAVKRTPGTTWVAVDGGMSDNLRPMLYGARYEAALADRVGEPGERCRVVGKHCESGDVLVDDVELADPRPGDVLVTPATGAYGHALANNYNAIPRPPVVLCAEGRARVVVRRETYDDLLARDVAG